MSNLLSDAILEKITGKKKLKCKFFLAAFTTFSLISILAFSIGEYEGILSWWILIAVLLPLLLWAIKTKYITLIVMCSLAFATQVITLPFFYLDKESFAWGAVDSADSILPDVFSILLKIALFLYLLSFLFIFFYNFVFIGKSSRNQTEILHNNYTFLLADHVSNLGNSNFFKYLLMLLSAIVILVPLNIWMFSQRIGLTGIAPPELPWHLSGVLHYFTKYISVCLIAYCYLGTKRGWLPSLLLIFYAYTLGFSSLSRGALIYGLLPVLIMTFLDRRWLIFILTTYLALIGVHYVSQARNYIYNIGNQLSSFEQSIYSIAISVISDSEGLIFDPLFLMKIMANLFERIDGFQNLILAQYYDAYQVSGPFATLINMLILGGMNIDENAHNLQWMNVSLPEGFATGGGLLSSVVILGNADFFWIVLYSAIIAPLLVLYEKAVIKICAHYNLPLLFCIVVVGFFTLFYFIAGSGTTLILYLYFGTLFLYASTLYKR